MNPLPGATPRRDFAASLAILSLIILLASAGLGHQGNWPKVIRVLSSFAAYAGTLLAAGAMLAPTQSSRLPYPPFALAGVVAGAVSGLIRPSTTFALVLTQMGAAALLLGGVHWFWLRWWRRLFTAIVRT